MARRHGENREFLYGLNPVAEALRGKRVIHRLWLREQVRVSGRVTEIITLAERRGVEVREVDARRLDQLSKNGNHQGVVLETGLFPYVDLNEMIERGPGRTVLILDRVQDPQNLATLIRTAVALDCAGIIIQTDRSSSITPAVVRSSAGVVERALVSRLANTRSALDHLKDQGYWIIGLESGAGSTDIYQCDLPQPAALVVGSEGSGVSKPVRNACDLIVQLPMPGAAESLNAAVAGSVALFELYRRRAAERDSELNAES